MSVSPAGSMHAPDSHSGDGRAIPARPTELRPDLPAFLGVVLYHVGAMVYRRRHDDRRALEFATSGCRRLIGYDPHDLIGPEAASYTDLIHPDDRDRVDAAVTGAVRREASFRVRYRIRCVDGSERLVSDHGYVTLDAHGRVVIDGVVTAADDGNASSAGALDERYEALVEQSLAGVYLIEDDRFTYVNRRFAEIFGYEVGEVLALPSVLELVHPEDRGVVADNLRRRMEGSTDEVRYEFRGRTREGECVYVEVHGMRIDATGSPRVLGILLDVTERRRAELGARESEKLEALARMAGGVAHDLNNFLSTIRSTAEVLQLERAGDTALADDLAEIVAAVKRGTTLSQQLSKFAFTSAGNREASTRSPSEVLSELTQTLKPLLGRRVELRTHLEPDLPEIPLAAGDLRHAVMNLVLNAQDAMRDGGTLTISASSVASDATPPEGTGRPAGVIVEVSDTGAGIPPANRAGLFDPYSGEESEGGSGLRLATVWRIVRGIGGTVEVDSSGRGSTFRLVLPAGPTA